MQYGKINHWHFQYVAKAQASEYSIKAFWESSPLETVDAFVALW